MKRDPVNSCFPFKLFFVRANLTQPSLLFHNTCYGCSRSWAKQTKNIYTQLLILRGVNTVLGKSPWKKSTPNCWCFLSHCEKKIYIWWPWMSFEILFWNSFGLHGCNQEGKEMWGTQHHRTRSQRGGGREPDHSFTFLLHFYFRHWKRKQKKSAKGRERLSWVNDQVQREELVGGYDHEMNCRAAMGRRAREKWMFFSKTASHPRT